MRYLLPLILLAGMSPANAALTTYLSTTTNATLGGVPMTNGDIVSIHPTRIEVLNRDLFGPVSFNGGYGSNKNIDDISKVPAGWVFSTSTDFTFGGQAYLDGDLVVWDGSGMSRYLPESRFASGNEDIDAFEILADGTLLVSTDSNATLGGVAFTPGDVVRYHPAAHLSTLYFRGADWFATAQDIDALAVLPDGSMLFSTVNDGRIVGLFNFLDGDIIRWTGGTGFSIWLSESGLLSPADDIDGLAVVERLPVGIPAPGTLFLSSAGLLLAYRKKP